MGEKEILSERMVLRIKALVALNKALIPAFCEGIETCNKKSCALWTNERDPCMWLKANQSIDELENVLYKLKRM
jgi:hypothetical protein